MNKQIIISDSSVLIDHFIKYLTKYFAIVIQTIYTSKMYCTDVVYVCNDHIITKFKPCDQISNSVYIAIYEPNDL